MNLYVTIWEKTMQVCHYLFSMLYSANVMFVKVGIELQLKYIIW